MAPHLLARVLGLEPLGHVHLRARGEDIDGHLHGFMMELVAVFKDNIGVVPVLLVHHHSSNKMRLGNTTGTVCSNLSMVLIGWLALEGKKD